MKQLDCILLIDDNVDDNFFHSIVIRECKAAKVIKTATNGEAAIEYFEKSKIGTPHYPTPDLVFLDINMPGMNGFEFLESAIKKNLLQQKRPVVIVMLTSSLNPNEENLAKEKFSNEIYAFKNKPLTEALLIEFIEDENLFQGQ